MRKHFRTAKYVAILCIIAIIMLFGCVPKDIGEGSKNYPFTVQGLAETSLNKKGNEHLGILSRAIGGYLENMLAEGKNVIDVNGETEMEYLNAVYVIDYDLFLDNSSAAVIEETASNTTFHLNFQKKDSTENSTLSFSEGLFLADIYLDGELQHFESRSEEFPFIGDLLSSKAISKDLYTVFGFVSFLTENNVRYAKKTEQGVEVGELLLCADLYSSISALLKMTVSMYRLDNPLDKDGLEKLKQSLNMITNLLFGKDYEKLVDLPIIYLNIDLIIHNGIAHDIKLSVTSSPLYGNK